MYRPLITGDGPKQTDAVICTCIVVILVIRYLGYIGFWSSGLIHQKINVLHILAITFPSDRTQHILVSSQQKDHKSN